MDVVIEGWLTKSPPDKKGLFKAKWRRRWFVLRDSGQIPGQYILEYYTDHKCNKLKGRVDLDQCEQVDVGWTSKTRKCIYNHVFDIQTPKRVYYLAAECEDEMNKWVNSICSVCGFKMHVEEDAEGESPATDLEVSNVTTTAPGSSPTPPASPAPSATSSAYIPISECVSGTVPVTNGFTVFRGRSVSVSGAAEAETEPDEDISRVPPPPPKGTSATPEIRSPSADECYDYPRRIHPPSLDAPSTSSGTSSPSLSSAGDMCPTTPSSVTPVVAAGSLRKGKEMSNRIAVGALMPRVNWTTYPVGDCELPPPFSMSRGNKYREEVDAQSSKVPRPPPRPPKPAHLTEVAGDEDHDAGLYDVPSSSLGVFLSKNAPASAFAYLKSDTSIDDVMSPPSVSATADDMYDFPRPLQDNKLNATPPAPASDAVGQWKHNYTNAPAGYLDDEDEASDGDTPLSERDEYLNMTSTGRTSDVYTDMSGSKVHGQAVYSNVPSPTGPCPAPNAFSPDPPPIVDRGLKPRSVAPEEPPKVNRGLKPTRMATATASRSLPQTTPQPTTRGPKPPALVIPNQSPVGNTTRPLVAKRSFRKPRKPSGTTPTPSIRTNHSANSTSGLAYGSLTSATRSDQSSSDDDHSSSDGSVKNSTTDDTSVRNMPRHEPEIQYLDLDLDSEAAGAQSPKSPERGSSHTVYKTVDFVKTKVFNEMRQNQTSYRKSH